MKSRFDADSLYSNNYLKLHGYAMCRRSGKRKKESLREKMSVPFPEKYILRRAGRVKKEFSELERKNMGTFEIIIIAVIAILLGILLDKNTYMKEILL